MKNRLIALLTVACLAANSMNVLAEDTDYSYLEDMSIKELKALRDAINAILGDENALTKSIEVYEQADTDKDEQADADEDEQANADEEWEAVRSAGMRIGDPVTVPGDFFSDGQERYKETGYILPQSSTKFLTEEDVAHLSAKGCCYARNC